MRTIKLQVAFEKQSTPYTCAAKAFQLVLNYHDPQRFPLGNSLEMNFLERAKLGNYDVATHPGLALVALEEGFDVDHIVVRDEVFYYPSKVHPGHTMPREEFEEKISIDRQYFQKARKRGLNTIIVPNVTNELLKDHIRQRVPLIAMTDSFGVLHDLIIRGFENDMFKVVDPIKGYNSIYGQHLLEQIHTRYGVSVLAIRLPKEAG